MKNIFIASTALVDESVVVGTDVKVWDYSKIREDVVLGDNTTVGDSVYIGPGVQIGKNSKIQNNAQIYEPAKICEGVFISPGVIFTNDHNPRAINLDKPKKCKNDWQPTDVEVCEGASVGAGAICVGPIQIGEWAMIGAGSVVIDIVLNYALVVGVPAKQIGWVGKAGVKLVEQNPTTFKCPVSGKVYQIKGINLVEVF
jgi:serine acetyltransferase